MDHDSFDGDEQTLYFGECPTNAPSYSHAPSSSDITSIKQSDGPSVLPSDKPSILHSDIPSHNPSDKPSVPPSDIPSTKPTKLPSGNPSNKPSDKPSVPPSDKPSTKPSDLPSSLPNDCIPSINICTRKEDSLIILYETNWSSKHENTIYVDMQKKWGFQNLKKIESTPAKKVLTYNICLKKNKCNRFRIFDKKGNGLGKGWYKLFFKGKIIPFILFSAISQHALC